MRRAATRRQMIWRDRAFSDCAKETPVRSEIALPWLARRPERLLNHASGTISGVAAVYNRHSYMDEMRAAVTAWEAKLQTLLNP